MKRALAAAAVLLVVAVAGWLRLSRRPDVGSTAGTASARPAAAAQPVPKEALGARLTLVGGAPGDDAVAVIRVFNARARQAAPLGDPAPVVVDLSQPVLAAGLSLQVEGESGSVQNVPATILRGPNPSMVSLGATPSAVIYARIAGANVPAPLRRLRAVLAWPGRRLETNWVTIERPVSDRPGQLAARARLYELIDPAGAPLADTAAALIAAAPADPRGYWYRALSLEARGDRPAALAAYRETARRLTPGEEPPIGLHRRIAALSR